MGRERGPSERSRGGLGEERLRRVGGVGQGRGWVLSRAERLREAGGLLLSGF